MSTQRLALAIVTVAFVASPHSGYSDASLDLATRQAAQDLVTTIGGGSQVARILAAMRGGMIQGLTKTGRITQEKAASAVDDILMPALKAHADELTPGFVAIYAENFSAPEMIQLKAFYQTPLGRKVLDKQPTIAAEASALGRAWGSRVARQAIQDHRQDLQKRGIAL